MLQCGRAAYQKNSIPMLLSSERHICHDSRVIFDGIIIFALYMLLTGCASEQPYPEKAIDFIVPWGEGGGTDSVSREFLSAVEYSVKSPFRIGYLSGESGVRGHNYLAKSDRTGYTLGAITSEITLMHWQKITNLTYRDYTPFGLLALDSAIVAVRTDSQWSSLENLLSSLKSHPEGTYFASGTARGGIWDLARVGFLRKCGLPDTSLKWVGSQGARSALNKLLENEIHVLFVGVPEVLEHVHDDSVRVLAVMAENRSSVIPEVPTLKELGIDFVLSGWVGFAGPPGLSDDVVDRLLKVTETVLLSKDFQNGLRQIGFEPRVLIGEDFERFLQEQDVLNGKLLEWAGLRVYQEGYLR